MSGRLSSFKTLSPDWPIPKVHAYTLLAETVDGQPVSFSFHTALGAECRSILEASILPAEPITWLKQVHGDTILDLPQPGRPEADASWTTRKRTVCVVQTADCLPVVFARLDGRAVGVAHAGRRGIENGLLLKMAKQLGKPSELLAWIGPGIAAESYPVSAEMKNHFLKRYPDWSFVFEEVTPGQYHMDLPRIAKLQLERAGLPQEQISGGIWNTFTDPIFHSARRDGEQSGRMATVVWME
jgi:YfiH family protein